MNPDTATIDHTVRARGRDKVARVDLGLELLRIAARPGAQFEQAEIAAWCGCCRQAISTIETRALRKVREKARQLGIRIDE